MAIFVDPEDSQSKSHTFVAMLDMSLSSKTTPTSRIYVRVFSLSIKNGADLTDSRQDTMSFPICVGNLNPCFQQNLPQSSSRVFIGLSLYLGLSFHVTWYVSRRKTCIKFELELELDFARLQLAVTADTNSPRVAIF
jgi:hypothetical protein